MRYHGRVVTRVVIAWVLACSSCLVEAPRYEHAQTVEAFEDLDFEDAVLEAFRKKGVVISARMVDGHPSLTLRFGGNTPQAIHVQTIEVSDLEGVEAIEVPADRDLTLRPTESGGAHRTSGNFEIPTDRETYSAMGREGYRITVRWRVADGEVGDPTVLNLPRTTVWTFGV